MLRTPPTLSQNSRAARELQGLKSVRENSSFALSGLAVFPLFTHGLRRGLYSCAASRLKVLGVAPP